ncbi:helix-turn-helix domain-containing protein [Burkholderia cepacia]|uniref:helix-turn-helix domain-containing protein n=1 Tax=Burkholderia cepacia TaxID=292 RepID=UPI002AB60808|nr:helix-turn-helix domain-containing protein [Burkholderia cepacia]
MEKIIQGVLVEGVLYVYRCPACGHRGEVRHADDSYDGAAATCAQCYGPVTLEWDGGVTLEATPSGSVARPPTAAELVHLRTRHGRTQAAVAARLDVTPRQVQRWEAGVGTMPIPSWQLLCLEWGTRFTEDFAPAPGTTRGWDLHRDQRRETIKRGDLVELQPAGASFYLRAIVTATSSTAIHVMPEGDGYWAIVTGFAGVEDTGDELGGFRLGERVSFALANVFHVEQRVPRS